MSGAGAILRAVNATETTPSSPLSRSAGEGLGVRATPSPSPPSPPSAPTLRERKGDERSRGDPAAVNATETTPSSPLSRSAGEGLGVRATPSPTP